MTQTTATRRLGGFEMPAVGTWRIDPSHADVSFVGRHFRLTKVRGRFLSVAGELHVAERPEDSSVTVTVDMSSVNSGFDFRDDNLRSAQFFDVENHPHAELESTTIDWDGSQGELTGELTIKGVTREITLEVRYLGHALDPWGSHRIGFEASARINREDWGITVDGGLDTGGLMVSREIDIEIHVEFVLETSES